MGRSFGDQWAQMNPIVEIAAYETRRTEPEESIVAAATDDDDNLYTILSTATHHLSSMLQSVNINLSGTLFFPIYCINLILGFHFSDVSLMRLFIIIEFYFNEPLID